MDLELAERPEASADASRQALVGLRERKKDETRRALAERALALAVQRGYAGFTITDLVTEVGVSRRTFSNYFGSKAECVAAVVDGWLDDVLGTVRSSPADASLIDIVETALFAVAQAGSERWAALQSVADAEAELAAQLLAGDGAIAEIVAEEVTARTGIDPADIRVKLLSGFVVTAGREVITRWAQIPPDQRSNDVFARLLGRAFSILNPEALDHMRRPNH